MKIFRAADLMDSVSLQATVRSLESGEIILYPTETFYAAGVDFLNKDAQLRLYDAKKRPLEKQLPVIVSDPEMVAVYCDTTDPRYKYLAAKYWPGPLTIVLPSIDKSASIAVRVSSNRIATQLAAHLNRPIVSTSANVSGAPPAQSPDQIDPALLHSASILIDAGTCPGGKPSTIVSLLSRKISILREGAIPGHQILMELQQQG